MVLSFFLGLTAVQCTSSPTNVSTEDLEIKEPQTLVDTQKVDRFSSGAVGNSENSTSESIQAQTDSSKKESNLPNTDDKNIVPNQTQTQDQKQQAIIDAFNKLDEGLFFSNIPQEMQVGQKEIVEAGIAKDKVDIQGLALDGSGKLIFEPGIFYNPLAVEIDLNVDSEAFEVKAISTGNKSTIAPNGKLEKWQWQITPLTAGTRNIFLTANVSFDVPELESKYNRDIKATTQEVVVKSNLLQTISGFFVKHWLKIFIVLLAPILGNFFWTLLIEKILSRTNTVKSDV